MRKVSVIFLAVVLAGSFAGCEKHKKDSASSKNVIRLESFKPKVAFKGEIVFQSDADGDNEIYLLTQQGVSKLTDNTWNDEYPRWSPDGKKIAFMANPEEGYEVFIMNRDGTEITQLTKDAGSRIGFSGLSWYPDGQKIAFSVEKKKGFLRNYTTWVIDVATKKLEKLAPQHQDEWATPNFSPTGNSLGLTAKKTIGWDVAVYDFETEKLTFLTEGGKACRPQFSKDGQKIAYVSSAADGKGDIWVMNPDGSGQTRITERDETFDYFPSWSPGRRRIVFCSSLKHYPYEGKWALFLVNVDTKKVVPLLRSSRRDLFPDWR